MFNWSITRHKEVLTHWVPSGNPHTDQETTLPAPWSPRAPAIAPQRWRSPDFRHLGSFCTHAVGSQLTLPCLALRQLVVTCRAGGPFSGLHGVPGDEWPVMQPFYLWWPLDGLLAWPLWAELFWTRPHASPGARVGLDLLGWWRVWASVHAATLPPQLEVPGPRPPAGDRSSAGPTPLKL